MNSPNTYKDMAEDVDSSEDELTRIWDPEACIRSISPDSASTIPMGGP